MIIALPRPVLVVLVGATSSGKSTFARQHFATTEVVSSDACRALLADDENALDINREAFALVHHIAAARLALGRVAVIDATNLQRPSRAPLLAMARQHRLPAVAIVLDLEERVLQERARQRADRTLPPHEVRGQVRALRGTLRFLPNEFSQLHVLTSEAEVDAVTVEWAGAAV